jgi:hypothetical protein
MPCNSDYMNATGYEIAISQVACLLDELNGKKFGVSAWRGYHPKVYGKSVNGDKLVSELCDKLQNTDVSKCSLEMQIWWRDHQRADKERLERELKAIKEKEEKAVALSKLTDYEKKILGL